MRYVYGVVVAMCLVVDLLGCDQAEPPSGNSSTASTAVALVRSGPSGAPFTVVFASRDNESRLPEILASDESRDFVWTKVTIESPRATDVISEDGYFADLRDPAAMATFTQVYESVCNPAREDTRTCLIYESYTAGEVGLSGDISMKSTATQVLGQFDVTWEGMTDRFGEPIQYLKHGTISGYAAPNIGEVIP